MLLGRELRYNRAESIARGGVSEAFADRLWRAFGFPQPPDDAVAFTDADVEALARIRGLLRTGVFDEEIAVRMARAAGQTLARLAEWQTDILVDVGADPLEPASPATSQLVAGLAENYLDELERLMVYAWRRQLAASATRALTQVASHDGVVPARGLVGVGFADIVAFTQLSRAVEEAELARIVERFEAAAADVVAEHGGRLVKTLGDEVLFSAETPERTAAIALGLAALGSAGGPARGAGGARAAGEPPRLRVGAAYGSVLPVMGDVFGTTVNLAARLTSLARPGAVLVDAGLAAQLDGVDGYDLARIVPRPARGLGLVQPYVLRRATRPDRS